MIEIKNLKKFFDAPNGFNKKVHAVDGVSFNISKGETLGLVGESGCGKTTLGRTIIKLYEPDEGKIIFDGKDITDISPKKMLPFRKKIQMIFQDPYASLNPRMTVGDIIKEPMIIHKIPKNLHDEKLNYLLKLVGLNSEHSGRYPHEFSGGQRQRVGIARALAVEPEFIICDEPISALDVSIQAQIVNMLEDLQKELGLTYLFIAHDLSMVKHISNRVAVMYLGKIVEIADSSELYSNPLHPYTISLLSSIPVPDPDKSKKRNSIVLEGEVPSALNPPLGCNFHIRCPKAKPECKNFDMTLKDFGNGHLCSCKFV
ncbi:MAG: ATP-binding cassette domain-containing protein [Synergistaceae bacterium]|nr:ATP-binding cassette domain-containing protein [Synergistaceae bacterium]